MFGDISLVVVGFSCEVICTSILPHGGRPITPLFLMLMTMFALEFESFFARFCAGFNHYRAFGNLEVFGD